MPSLGARLNLLRDGESLGQIGKNFEKRSPARDLSGWCVDYRCVGRRGRPYCPEPRQTEPMEGLMSFFTALTGSKTAAGVLDTQS